MTSETKGLVASLQDGLQLFSFLAADFTPRTHSQIVDLAKLHSRDWSSTKIHNMLTTLAAEHFVRQAPTGEWSISPHITAIAVNYQSSIIRRSEALIAEVAEIKKSQEEMQ